MNTHADKTQENKSQSVSKGESQMQSSGESTFQFVDNRPEAMSQRKLKDIVNDSPQAKQAIQLQAIADNNSAQQPILKTENNTGLPDNLKTGMENLSGMSLDDVKVHRNSAKPAQLQAHAYAQGTDIHLGSGQEKHLPHEAWHVVQQKQGRVKPTMQMKDKVNVNVNDDAGLEKEADVMGAKASQDTNHIDHAPIQNRSAGFRQVVQLKPETVKITGLTHLVQMDKDKPTIFGGKPYDTVKSGDLVTIERDVTYKSRRGPNQEDPELKETDRTGGHIYTWFQAKDVNGDAVGAGNVFLRDLTFKKSPSDGAFDEEKEQLIKQKEKLAAFKLKAKLVIGNLGKVLTKIKDHPGFNGFTEGMGNVDGAYTDLRAAVNIAAPRGLSEIDQNYGEITGQMKQLYLQLETQAYESKAAEEPELGRSLISVADQAYRISEEGELIRSNPTGEEITTGNDAVGDAFGNFDAAQTGIYGIGGGILGTPGVFAAGSFGAGFATGFAYVAGPLGIICGLVGIGLGIRVAWRGYDSEKKLKKLIPSLDQANVKRIAIFAAEKKRKKKWGGAIVITAGVAAVLAGALGIAALSIATLGIGAAVLGIGAALIGLSIGIGKLIQRIRKRKKWRGKMAEMVLEAVRTGENSAFPPSIMVLGKTVIQHSEGSRNYKTAMKTLEDACVDMAESRRSLLALDAVRFLLNGTPGEKFEATLVVEALKVSKEKISETVESKGENAAASLVARKMKSW